MIITNDLTGDAPGGRLRVGIPGRHQFGIAAGFRLECMAGFVGIRRSGLFCPDPSSLTRPHPPHSQAHRDFTARRLIRDAFAVRERRSDPRVVPGFRCTFLPDMPSSPTPGSSSSISRNFDADIGLRRMTTGSALPSLPRSVPRGRSISWLHWFASATACQVARPPVRIRLERPAFGDFYFQAFNGSVSLPVAGYNYNSDWTPLLAALSPAGMAASLAARSFSTDASTR